MTKQNIFSIISSLYFPLFISLMVKIVYWDKISCIKWMMIKKWKNIKKSFVFNKLKNIDGLFLHKRRLVLRFFLEKVNKLDALLIRGRHGFYVLKVERVLNFPSIGGRCLIHSNTTHHVGIGRCEAIGLCIIVSRMVPVSVAPYNVIPITWTRSWIGCYLYPLVLNLLKIHLLCSVVCLCVGLSNTVCSVTDVYASCILQV